MPERAWRLAFILLALLLIPLGCAAPQATTPRPATAQAAAPAPEDPERADMAAAEEMLARRDWAGAAGRLGELLSNHPGSPYAPLARLKLAFAYLRLARFEEAATLLRAASAESRSRVEVLLMLAEAEEGAGRPQAAFEAAQEALARSGQRAVARTCQERLKALGAVLDAAQAEDLSARLTQGYGAGVLRLRRAELAAEAGDSGAALRLLETFAHDFPGHDLTEEADALRRQLEGEGRGAAARPLTIGVLIPQEGGFRAVGEQVLKGLMLATDVFAGEPRPARSFRLAVRELGSSGEAAAAGLRELATQEEALAVVALLGSAHGEAAAREARRLAVPLLALCQDPKLPVGGGVFRNFLTPRAQVERLARFAEERGMNAVAILYPRDAYGREMAALMREAAPLAGLRVAAEASYEPAHTNVGEAIGRLLAGRKGPDDLPFQAVFVPDGSQKALLVLPQFAVAKVRGVAFLGPNLWNDPRFAKGMAGTGVEVYFADAFETDSTEPAAAAFIQGFRDSFGEEPGYLAAQSYDDAWMVIRAVEAGAGSREELVRILSGLTEFPGVTGHTGFGPDGEARKALRVFTVRGGQIRPAN